MKRRVYDPKVEEPPAVELPPVRGMLIELPGVYVAAEDVQAVLARYAEQWHGEAREALYEMARFFGQMEAGDAADEPSAPPEAPPAPEVVWVPQPVVRAEVFPNEDGSYWYGRGVAANGVIVDDGVSGINHDGVIDLCRRRWPDADIFEVPDSLSDSVWQESNPAATWNGRHRPSERRLFGR